jgi:RHS repeat-associated protein
LADATGAVTASNSYNSFGNPTNTSFPSRYQYTGREFDPFTGLQFSRARWYDPNLGRFISEDPIGFGGGDINLYGYVWNSPLGFIDPMGLDGWGNDAADWMDDRIEYSRQWWQDDQQDWVWNGSVNTGADLAYGYSDMLRVGSGLGYALYADDENIYGRLAFASMDIARGAGIFALIGYPGARFANSRLGCALNEKLVNRFPGREYTFGNPPVRLAPFGNRTGHPTGEKPHYHRQRFDDNGNPKYGQGKKRHRPWDTKSSDTSFWDRF